MKYDVITEVFTQPLAVDPNFTGAYWMMLRNMLTGIKDTDSDYSKERSSRLSYAVSSTTLQSARYSDLSEAPEGSIAIVNLSGPVVKYDQFCGPRGTTSIAHDLENAKSSKNIKGVVFRIESGGGMALAVKPLTDVMTDFGKPIVVLAGDYLCSAAYYIAAYADEIVSEHPRATIGSIGTMLSCVDPRPAMEKEGYVFHEAYATQSVKKNKDFKSFLEGDYKPVIKKSLDPFNEDFVTDVKREREGIISDHEDIYQGETFDAKEAISLGMIDHLGGLQKAIDRVNELASAPQKSKTPQSTLNMSLTNVKALAGVQNPTTEQVDLANADLTIENITTVTLVPESMITDAAEVSAERDRLAAELATANSTLLESQNELTTANQTIASLTSRVAELEKKPGAENRQAIGADVQPETSDNIEELLASMDHNKRADKLYS